MELIIILVVVYYITKSQFEKSKESKGGQPGFFDELRKLLDSALEKYDDVETNEYSDLDRANAQRDYKTYETFDRPDDLDYDTYQSMVTDDYVERLKVEAEKQIIDKEVLDDNIVDADFEEVFFETFDEFDDDTAIEIQRNLKHKIKDVRTTITRRNIRQGIIVKELIDKPISIRD